MALYQEAWRRAGAGEVIRIECGSAQEAVRVRLALYRAVKEARRPGGLADEVLKRAVENSSVQLEGAGKTTVAVRPNLAAASAQSLMKALGVEGGGVLQDAETRAGHEMLARLEAGRGKAARLQADSAPDPFARYGKED